MECFATWIERNKSTHSLSPTQNHIIFNRVWFYLPPIKCLWKKQRKQKTSSLASNLLKILCHFNWMHKSENWLLVKSQFYYVDSIRFGSIFFFVSFRLGFVACAKAKCATSKVAFPSFLWHYRSFSNGWQFGLKRI